MDRSWVVNASPVIVLAKIGYVDFLQALCKELVIPLGAAEEIRRGHSTDPSVQWINTKGKLFIREDAPSSMQVNAWDLGEGETTVLAWAHHYPQFEAIVDDRAARNCASALNISIRGTLGVLLLAKREGIVDILAPILSKVREAGLHVRDDLYNEILRIAEEL